MDLIKQSKLFLQAVRSTYRDWKTMSRESSDLEKGTHREGTTARTETGPTPVRSQELHVFGTI